MDQIIDEILLFDCEFNTIGIQYKYENGSKGLAKL